MPNSIQIVIFQKNVVQYTYRPKESVNALWILVFEREAQDAKSFLEDAKGTFHGLPDTLETLALVNATGSVI